jgi:hypothetical protein
VKTGVDLHIAGKVKMQYCTLPELKGKSRAMKESQIQKY